MIQLHQSESKADSFSQHFNNVLNIPQRKVGGYEIKHDVVKAGKELSTSSMRTAIFGGQKIEKVSFSEDTIFHRLESEEHGTWMTDTPIEQAQHDDIFLTVLTELWFTNQLEQRNKFPSDYRILVGGLGLGYAPKVLQSLGAKHITIVERSEEVINLIEDSINVLDDVELEIVHEDLFEFLKDAPSNEHTWNLGFYDIWQGDGEFVFHDTVVPLRRLSKGRVTQVVNWNEDVMRGQLNSGLRQRLMFMNHSEDEREALSEGVPNGNGPWNFITREVLVDTDHGSLHGGNWSRPFWKAYFDKTLDIVDWDDQEELFEAASTYASLYGLTEEYSVEYMTQLLTGE
tara:strand:+ start:611 stop:1639 length:1029 start_codon:yes stop_codon:yes gene_type:complete